MAERASVIWADGPTIRPTQPDKSKIRAWGTLVEQQASIVNSPLTYDASGDGATDDAANYAVAESDNDSIFLAADTIFNLNASKPTKPIYGPGAVMISGVLLGKANPLVDMVQGNVSFTPDSYSELVRGETQTPGTSVVNYFNTFIGSGSGRPVDLTKLVTRSTGVGSAIGERAINWERVDAFGNGAMRFAPYADRVTAIGTLAFQWAGGTSQQFLKDTYHDLWLKTAFTGMLYPGEEGPSKTITGITNASPGYVTIANHGFTNGQSVKLTSIGGMTQLNGGVYIVRGAGTNEFRLEDGWGLPVDTTGFGVYTSGGVAKLQWNFQGMESRAPGLGAVLAAFSSYPTTKDDFTLNIAVGRDAGLHAIKGTGLNFLGYQAGTNAFNADSLVGIGTYALRDAVFLSQTVGIGNYAGIFWQTGTRNLIAGHNAAPTVVDGSNNTIVGPYAANGPTKVDNSVLLGYQAGIGWGSILSEVLAIQRGASRAPLIGGKFDVGFVGINPPSLGAIAQPFKVWDFAGAERFGVENGGFFSFSHSDDGAGVGPVVELRRLSASPAASDLIAALRFVGFDSAANTTNYADIFGTIITATDGAEASRLTLRTMVAGALSSAIQIDDLVRLSRPLVVSPAASVTPATNGDVMFQLTSNTSLTFKVKGSDGVVRSGSIALS